MESENCFGNRVDAAPLSCEDLVVSRASAVVELRPRD
jgi:hypothetical protein